MEKSLYGSAESLAASITIRRTCTADMITFGFRNKFSGWIRAAIAVLIGCVMVFKPETSLIFLVKVIATIMIASGIVTLAYGVANRRSGGLGLLAFNTVVDIIIGVLLFIFPEFVASFVIILIGVALLIFGIFQIAAMISAASFVSVNAWSFLLPVICAGGGMLLLFKPFDAASTMTLVAGAAILIYGVSELFSSWKMHRAMKEYEIRFPSSGGKSAEAGKDPDMDFSKAKDAEFHKADTGRDGE